MSMDHSDYFPNNPKKLCVCCWCKFKFYYKHVLKQFNQNQTYPIFMKSAIKLLNLTLERLLSEIVYFNI